jgi:L-threonylcarbamoyladenylate synthase
MDDPYARRVLSARALMSETHDIARAARRIRAGKLVAFPTETVYGLGADATSDRAVAAVYAAKSRPRFNPLIVHVDGLVMAARLAVMTPLARRLARAFWPGPLTLVLKRRADCRVSLLASAGLDTLALRVPDHHLARALIRSSGKPLVGPSANRSGRVSPTRADHVRRDLARRDVMVLDGGACRVGIESTVVDARGARPVLLRPGGVPADAIARIAEMKLTRKSTAHSRHAPGQLASHYAPRAKLRLDALSSRDGEAYLAFGRVPAASDARRTRNLSASRDLAEAAANLFAMLRDLDRRGVTAIAVAPIPSRGLGAAINDRLRRAAAPRGLTPGSDPGVRPRWITRLIGGRSVLNMGLA